MFAIGDLKVQDRMNDFQSFRDWSATNLARAEWEPQQRSIIKDLIFKSLTLNPERRPTAEELIQLFTS
jgi:hypothetical protein